jgi:hypothetical protein
VSINLNRFLVRSPSKSSRVEATSVERDYISLRKPLTREKLISGYGDWLSRFKWNLFCTLTFRIPDLPTWKANQIFKQWIWEIKHKDGSDDFHWFRVNEHGAYGDNLHFHVLVGGLRNGSKWPWIVRWNELAGDALITYYFLSGGASRYIVKTARPDRDFEIDFDLS